MKRKEIVNIFNEIELEILGNLRETYKRNFNDLPDNKKNFELFQTQALSDLESFRRQNRNIINSKSRKINKGINSLIKETYTNNARKEQRKIIDILGEDKVKNVNKPFNINNKKLTAILVELKDNTNKSKLSILRESEDLYKKVITKASIYNQAGYETWDCVDKASRDFLQNGISCIKFKDGRSMNVGSYSEMCLRTAETRAGLAGEAAARDRQGMNTVLVSSYANCSELCIDWQGKIYEDDVYSNLECKGKYPRLSEAVAGGLFHPNCRHTVELYVDGLDMRQTHYTKQQKENIVGNYKLEQQQRYNERQIRKYKGLREVATSEKYRQKYSSKVEEWTTRNNNFINENSKVLHRDIEREKLRPSVIKKI